MTEYRSDLTFKINQLFVIIPSELFFYFQTLPIDGSTKLPILL